MCSQWLAKPVWDTMRQPQILQGVRTRVATPAARKQIRKSERERGGVVVRVVCMFLCRDEAPFCLVVTNRKRQSKKNAQYNEPQKLAFDFLSFVHHNSSFLPLSSPTSRSFSPTSNHAARAAATTAGTSTHTTLSKPFTGTCPRNGR